MLALGRRAQFERDAASARVRWRGRAVSRPDLTASASGRAAGKAPVTELLTGPPQAAFWEGVLAIQSPAGVEACWGGGGVGSEHGRPSPPAWGRPVIWGL